jgi:serine protease Do
MIADASYRSEPVSIFACVIAVRWRRALALILPMTLVLLAARIAHADTDPDPVAAMVARVAPAVVRVVTVRPATPPATAEADKPGAQTANAAASDRTSTASGSGYIIGPAGYIGTNRHVVDGAISVFVVTADGVRYPARIVGMPEQADIALLKIDAGRHQLPYVPLGDSDKVRVGEKVIAIGSPFGFDNTVTSGIISALNRDIMESPFDDYIQIDAAINHGNSGGPLFNMAGEVIGMNSIIFAPTSGFAGLAFAVPSDSLRFVFDRLMTTGEVKAGMLPIHTQQVTWMLQQALEAPDRDGALVTSVQDDNGAMLQGKIQPGDVIRTFGGRKVLDPRDLARQAARTPIGSDVTVELYRAGGTETAHVTIQAWPEAKPVVLDNDGPRTLGLRLASAEGENGRPIVTVAEVEPTGTAADSGIQKGDIIVEVQQTRVSQPDQALRIFWAQSLLKHRFAAVLVQRDKKSIWMPLAVPE